VRVYQRAIRWCLMWAPLAGSGGTVSYTVVVTVATPTGRWNASSVTRAQTVAIEDPGVVSSNRVTHTVVSTPVPLQLLRSIILSNLVAAGRTHLTTLCRYVMREAAPLPVL
jgi:hypothetical protein